MKNNPLNSIFDAPIHQFSVSLRNAVDVLFGWFGDQFLIFYG